jgi:hypothetical protein
VEGEGAGEANDALERDGDARVEHVLELEWYANWFDVGHSALQFKIDCGRAPTHDGEVRTMYIRVTSDALRARELFQLLGSELLAFMDKYGPIVPEHPLGESP